MFFELLRSHAVTRVVSGLLGDLEPKDRLRSVAIALQILQPPASDAKEYGFLRDWLDRRDRSGRAAAAFESSGGDQLVFLAFELDPNIARKADLHFVGGMLARWQRALAVLDVTHDS